MWHGIKSHNLRKKQFKILQLKVYRIHRLVPVLDYTCLNYRFREIISLYHKLKIYGKNRNKKLIPSFSGLRRLKQKKMIMKGKSKQEILKATGCTVAVRNANLEIEEGEMFVIMGLSGSGKSTLLRCINRLNEPSMGEIRLNGVDITRSSDKELLQIRRKEMAMVFQHFGLLPHRTVLNNVSFGLELQGVLRMNACGKRRRVFCL